MLSSGTLRLIDRRTLLALGSMAGVAAILGPARANDLYGPKAAGAKSGGSLNMGLLVEPPGLDPFHQAADARIRLTVLIYQGLFYESPDGSATPLLAEGFDLSSDRLVYTVRLRKGVKFHTGQPMTAKDVAYSYNYIRDPKNGSPGAGDFAMITSVEAIDDATVKISISAPNAALPMTLGNKYGGVVPAGYFDEADAKTRLNQTSVGTGPFKLSEFKPNSTATLVRNPDYWEPGIPYLDRINFVFVPNAASLLVGLRNKRIDIATLTRPQDLKQVEGAAGLVVERTLSFNQKAIDLGSELKPLDDERVRRAIALGVDKEEIMRASIGGLGNVIGTMVAGMQQSWGVPLDQLPNQKVDIAAAKKLLAEAGHDARLIGAAVAVADAVVALVLRPQAVGGVEQERVRVLGDGQVERGAADLEHAAALALARAPHRHPDALDEEVVVEDVGEDALGLADAARGRAEVAERIGGLRGDVDVVAEHEALRLGHGQLGFVDVGALGQREQLGDPREDAVGFR